MKNNGNNGFMSTAYGQSDFANLEVPMGGKPASDARKEIQEASEEASKQKYYKEFVKDHLKVEDFKPDDYSSIFRTLSEKGIKTKNVTNKFVEIDINGTIYKLIK